MRTYRSQSMNVNPKHCPFCGNSTITANAGAVSCYQCSAKIELQNCNTHYAVERWNTRAPDVSALVEALELISDTDPNEGAAWFHEIAYKALATHRKGEAQSAGQPLCPTCNGRGWNMGWQNEFLRAACPDCQSKELEK